MRPLAVLVVLFAMLPAAWADQTTWHKGDPFTMKSVLTGDTIHMMDHSTLHLEDVHADQESRKAKEFLQDLLWNMDTIRYQWSNGSGDGDYVVRLTGKCGGGPWLDVNVLMVASGNAEGSGRLAVWEQCARRHKRGMWK